MNKIDTYTLNNGLKVVLYSDKTKHCSLANLYIKFGGLNKSVIINDEEKVIKDGTAHLMEHLLYEHSIYGESNRVFFENHSFSNATTNKNYTNYYVNSVVNFEEDLIKLINIVNNPCFTKENIEEVRSAIVKEKMMSKDRKFEKLNIKSFECLFNNTKYPNVLGEVEDINSISYEDVKMCYDTFYNPNNQILFVVGNFDIDNIKKIIEDTYKSIQYKHIDYQLPDIKETDEIHIKEASVTEDINMNYVRISYKINTSKLSSYEKVKLSFYIFYFTGYLYGPDSDLYQKLIKEGICTYDIDSSIDQIDDYLLLIVGTFTNNKKEFVKEITSVIDNKLFNEKDFDLRKKDTLIKVMLREDNLFNLTGPMIDNVLTYDYYDFDTLEDINNQNFDDYKNMINSLDFTNYCITEMIKEV